MFVKNIFTIDQIEHGAVSDFVCSDEFPSYPIYGIKSQFTGLKDKNGVDIYESDVIDAQYNYMGKIVVKFKGGKFNIADFCLAKCVVIGNTHENPELLGG